MKGKLIKWLDSEVLLFTPEQKRIASSIIHYCLIAFFFGIITYALLAPYKNRTPVDKTFVSLISGIGIGLFILLELIVGAAYLRYSSGKNNVFIMGILLISFTTSLVIRNVYGGLDLLMANICLSTLVFATSGYLAYSVPIYRKSFPLLLLVIFTLYGFIALIEIASHPLAGYRLQMLFNHPNHLGNVLAFALVFCFSIAISVTNYRYQIILAIPVVLLVFSLIHTVSRGAWLGGFIGLLMSIYYLKRHVSLKMICISVAMLMLVITGSIIAVSPGYVVKRFSSDSSDVQLSIGNRIVLWRITTRIIQDHWLTGIGIGNFGESLINDYHARFANKGAFQSAMNNYLTLAAEAGIPILLLYLVCLFYACRIALISIHTTVGLQTGINVGLLCGIYSMLIFALTTYTLGRVYATVLVWSSFGYLLASKDHVVIPEFMLHRFTQGD